MRRLAAVGLAALLALGLPQAIAQESSLVTRDARVAMDDGVEVAVRYGGRSDASGRLPARPTIVEFSPYAPGCCDEVGGPEFNYAHVHIRGTGRSAGSFDALGPRSQADVAAVLDWICAQSWTDGRLGLVGFSASAIMIYNSLHLELPCVETAVLGSGTFELYRDLMYPGGVPNMIPALGVLGLITAPLLAELPDRLAGDPASLVDALNGMGRLPVEYQSHPTLDAWWAERGFRGDANDLPILMVDGFFDVESRGAFQAFQELRDDGAHLLVVGAHDGVPTGLDAPGPQRRAWFEHHLLDVDNGIDREPRVQLVLADGDRGAMLAGRFVRLAGDDWPLPGTEWESLHLDPSGALTAGDPTPGTASYPVVPSLFSAVDPYNASIVGVNDAPPFTDMTLVEPLGLSFTTEPFASPVLAVGPASVELVLSSTAPATDLWVVLSDVSPDGTARAMAAGRLRSSFPGIDRSRSLVDTEGNVVQPYGTYAQPEPTAIGAERRYHVEVWPIGNRFDAGHRLRLHVLGASIASQPSLPAMNTVRLGPGQSRLLFPIVPSAADAAAPVAPSGPTAGVAVGERLPATGGEDRLLGGLVALAITLSVGGGARWRCAGRSTRVGRRR